MRWRIWVDRIVGRYRHNDDELDGEIRAHLEEKIDSLIARGMSPVDAAATARREFGNISLITERSRDVWRWPFWEALKTDTRYAIRLIARYPAFSANVILIAAVGIAACATTFSLVSGVLLAPLPFANPNEVFGYQLRGAGTERTAAVPLEAYQRVQQGSPVVQAIAATAPRSATATWNGEPHVIRTLRVTSSFFQVFGVAPILGRPFTQSENDHNAPVLLLGHSLWRSRFNGDSGVVGTTMRVDSTVYTIIGIMPARFQAHMPAEPDVWVPHDITRGSGSRDGSVNAQLRLKSGVSQQQAEAWLSSAVAARIESRTTRDSVPATATLIPVSDEILGDVEQPLRILLGSVILVLALISANIATMFVARTSSRDQELVVRRALGASGLRQTAQLITEACILVGMGGLLGIMLSYWLIAALRSLGENMLPRMNEVAMDQRVLLFAFAASAIVGVVSGALPAFLARRQLGNPNAGSRVVGQRTSSTLVVAQIALSVMLLVGAGLLMKGFLRVMPSSPGFALDHRNVVLVRYSGPKNDGVDSALSSKQFVAVVTERMRRVEGVRDVAVMSYAPFYGSVWSDAVEVPGRPQPAKPFTAYQNVVSQNLLEVLEMRIARGRGFGDRDREGSEPVAIVNESAAERWWPGENAVGRQLVVTRDRDRIPVTIVGVMKNARLFGTDSRMRPELYLPMLQVPSTTMTFIVHTDGRSVPQRELERVIWSVAPSIPISYSGELADIAMNSVRRPRFFASAMGAFAVVAVLLSAIAIYGLLTLDVVQRRREIGVRMALGATAGTVGSLVLKRAAILGGIGVLIGIVVARMLSKFMESLLVEVSATDATVFVATAGAALLVASVAASAPAFRAARVDPVNCLRGE